MASSASSGLGDLKDELGATLKKWQAAEQPSELTTEEKVHKVNKKLLDKIDTLIGKHGPEVVVKQFV